jgi:hypothetical protein
MLSATCRPQGRCKIFWLLTLAAGTELLGRRFEKQKRSSDPLAAKRVSTMSPILPISFLLTLLCAFGAVEGVLYQQLIFVGAALSATILVCSVEEAWSAREIPVRSDDERESRDTTRY